MFVYIIVIFFMLFFLVDEVEHRVMFVKKSCYFQKIVEYILPDYNTQHNFMEYTSKDVRMYITYVIKY